MFSDRRMILGALVVLIGLLLFTIASPLSPFSHATDAVHEDDALVEHIVVHEHHEAYRHEQAHATRSNDSDYTYSEVIEKKFNVRPGQTLLLDTDFGKVTVHGSAGEEAVVTVTKGVDDMSESRAQDLFDRFDVTFDQNGTGITVEGDYDGERNWGRRNRLQVEYEISVPHAFNVKVKTAGGSIVAEDLRGDADLRTAGGSVQTTNIDGPLSVNTSGGSIKADRIGGPARLHTSGGSITARNVDGSVDCNTSGGSITVEDANGDVEAHTSGGSIRLTGIHGTANARTSGGSVTADLRTAPTGPMELETSGGSVTLRLTEDTRIDIDAHASGGSVRTDMPVQVEGELSRTRLKGEINGGGPLVKLRSSGGGIKILKQ